MLRDDIAAVEHGRRAVTLDPSLGEAWYNLAKYAAAAGKPEIVTSALGQAIVLDRNYAVKVCIDSDFATMDNIVRSLLQRLTSDAKRQVEDCVQAIQGKINGHMIPAGQRSRIEGGLAQIASLCSEGTLFACQDALIQVMTVQQIIDDMRLDELEAKRTTLLAESDRLRREAESKISDSIWLGQYIGELSQLTEIVRNGDMNGCANAQSTLGVIGKQLTEKVNTDRQRAEKLRQYTELKQQYEAVSKEARELTAAVIVQSEEWGQRGCCIDCGDKLSFMEKARGYSRCSDCKFLEETNMNSLWIYSRSLWVERKRQQIPSKQQGG
jgi:hypothetical protein